MLSLDDVIPLYLAEVTFPDAHPLRGQTGDIFAFAIRHPSGLILFESGIGRGNDALDSYYQVLHRPIEVALEQHELHLADVRVIVNSHLHFDHCGNNLLFAGVPIYVQSSEYQAAHQPMYTVREWIDFPDAEYRQIEGDKQIANGVRIITTPGHTIGHQSLVVETGQGAVLLVGQAIYSRAECNQISSTGKVPPEDPAPDPERYLQSARRLIERRPRRILFSHDRNVWDRDGH